LARLAFGLVGKRGYAWVSMSTQFEVLFKKTKTVNCHSGMWKRLNFCVSGSTLKKEAGSGSKLGSI